MTWRGKALLLLAWLVVGTACGGNRRTETGRDGNAPPADLAALFRNLPPPQLDDDGHARLLVREGPPVPQPNHSDSPFPPVADGDAGLAPAEAARTFTVLGYSPQRSDEFVGAVRVTFSEPMVPIEALSEQRLREAPLEISPAVPGRFRWLGTDTVVFEPTGRRMPMSTSYLVRLRDGVQSANGHSARQAFSFSFKTPAVELVQSVPEDGATALAARPIVALRFNQRVDLEQLLASLSLSGGASLVRVPVGAELNAFVEKNSEIKSWDDGYWIAVQPTTDLALNRAHTLTVARGARGADGPDLSQRSFTRTYRTHGPFAFSRLACFYFSDGGCRPGRTPTMEFTNALAETNPERLLELIRIEPAVRDLRIEGSGSIFQLIGEFEAATPYKVTVDARVTDEFGQHLTSVRERTVTFGDAEPWREIDAEQLATLEAGNAHVVPVDLINTSSMLVNVGPLSADQVPTALHAISFHGGQLATDFLRRPVTLNTSGPRNQWQRVGIDISNEIPERAFGAAFVDMPTQYIDFATHDFHIVQATDLGLTAITDNQGGAVRVTSIATGTPIEGADIAVSTLGPTRSPSRAVGRTDRSGFLRFDMQLPGDAYRVIVQASKGSDHAATMAVYQHIRGGLVGEVLTDRDPYRPGDTVHMRIVARRVRGNAAATVQPLANGFPMDCRVSNSFGMEVAQFDVRLNEYGTAVHDFPTRSDAATGTWHTTCSDRGGGHYDESVLGSMHIEEYRAPEIEVHVTGPTTNQFLRDRAEFRTQADYLFGAHAAGLPVSWTLGREAFNFSPPGQSDFTFGDNTNLLFGPRYIDVEQHWGRDRAVFGNDQAEREIIQTGNGTLDNDGALHVAAELEEPNATPRNPRQPQKFVLEAVVTDTSRQTVAGRVEVTAHVASLYGGIRTAQFMVREDQPLVSRHIVAGIDGQRAVGVAIRVRVYQRRSRLVARNLGGRWVYEYSDDERKVGECNLVSARGPVECRVAPQRAGNYVIESVIEDPQHREQISRANVYVYGRSFSTTENTGAVDITTDKQEYRVGETAHLLVRVPFANARGLLVRERAGVVSATPLDLEGNVQQVDVPVTEADIPQFSVRLALQRGRASEAEVSAILSDVPEAARATLAADIGRPQWATGTAQIVVNPAPKRLRVDVRASAATIAPGSRLGVDVLVREPNGSPANAEVAIVVVDESVLSLLNYQTPNPVDILHRSATSVANVESVFAHMLARENLRAARPRPRGLEQLLEANAIQTGFGGLGLRGTGRGGGGSGEGTIGLGSLGTIGHGAGGGESATAAYGSIPTSQSGRPRAPAFEAPTHSRSLFATTAYFRGNVRTDARGRAHVDVTMPENLTTFRIMAIAIGRDDHSGSGEAKVRVQKPVVLRPALPRFATYGDRFGAGVVVHNETGHDADFVVGIRAAGFVVENSGLSQIHLARGGSQLVTFPVRVDAAATTAHVQFAAATANGADATDVAIPLVAPATGEAFATYGSVETGSFRVPVVVPRDVIPHFGGLRVSLSTTALTGFDDAVEWLNEYPYPFCEPVASRLVGASALKQLYGEGRSPDGAARAELIARSSLDALLRLQRRGGFAAWSSARRIYLDESAWGTFALLEARRAGLEVPERALNDAFAFLSRRVEHPAGDIGEDGDYVGQAFALFVLAEGAQTLNAEVIDRVHHHVRELPVFARAWLERAMRHAHDRRADDIWRDIANGAVLTASGAHFAETRVESARLLWHSERRTDAIVLTNLLDRAPNDPLVERTARALSDSRVGGHWLTTNETAWALSAFAHYARVKESVTPNTSVNAWLGNDFLGATEFRGRSATTHDTSLPMIDLLARPQARNDVVIAGDGAGRVYYRIGLRYAPTDFRLPPESQGFTVSRTYEPIDAPDTVRRDDNGVWHVKVESNVRVRVTLVIPDDRYDVVLDDPLPAGFEGSNLSFSTTATQALSGELDDRNVDFDSFFALWAFDHRELRDDRTVAVARRAPAGVYELTYLTRATTPGTFVATAPHIEEMYSPETFARGVTETVVVEP